MRLIRAEIYGFGHVKHAAYDFRESGITILYGPNESGKTTIMECIRSILYGFETTKQRLRYEPVQGGKFGGKLTFLLQPTNASNHGITIERVFNGRSLKGEVSVVDFDGQMLGSENYVQGLLQYLAPQVYRSIYAFGLTELEDLHSLSEADIQARIHSAGMGMKNGSPIELERSLETKRVGLYRKRGQEQPITKRIRDKQALKKKLQQLAEMPRRYSELQDQYKQLQATLIQLSEKQNQIDTNLDLLAVHKAIRELWEEVIPIERSIQSLQDLPTCTPALYYEWQELRADQTRLEKEIQELNASLESQEQILSNFPDSSEWVYHRQDIIELYEMKNSIVEAIDRSKQLGTEIELAEHRLQETVHRLGNQLNADTLKKISVSLNEYERIETFHEMYQELRGQISSLTTQLEKLEEELEQTDLLLAQLVDQINLKNSMHSIDLERIQTEELAIERIRQKVYELDAYRHGLREAQQRYDDLYQQSLQARSSIRSRKSQASNRVNRSRKQQAWSGVSIVCLFVMAWLLPLQRITLLVIGGSLSVGLLSWLVWSMKSRYPTKNQGHITKEQSISDSDPLEVILVAFENDMKSRSHKVDQTRQELLTSTQALKVVLISDDTEDMLLQLQQHARKLQSAKDDISDVNRLSERQAELMQQRQRIFMLCEKKQTAIHDAKRKHEQWETDWKAWLADNFMPQTLLPENAYVFMQTVERGKELLHEIERKKLERSELDKKTTEYIKHVHEIGRLLHVFETNPHWGVAIQLLFNELQRRLLDGTKKEQIVEERALQLQRKQALEQAKEALRNEMLHWLEEKGFREPAEVMLSYESTSKRRELEQQLKVLYAKMEAKVGVTFNLQESIEVARQHDVTTWDRMLTDAELERMRILEKIEENRRLQGKLELELEQLEQATEHSEAVQQLAIVDAELQELAQQWAVYTLTQKLLEQARKTYELERQPAVLKQASVWFRSITEERYEKVISPFGSDVLDVRSTEQTQLSTTSLSRGTAEQLYLTMRFALLDELFEKGIYAPVILDDVFVNFDSNRLLATLRVLNEVANRHQVLYFTCHSHIVDSVLSQISQFEVVSI